MKIAIAQINTTVGALKANTSKIIETIQRAKSEGAELVLFPELAITGYPPMDLLDQAAFTELNLKCLDEITESCQNIAAIIGFIDRNKTGQGKSLYNAAAFIENGKVTSIHHKSLLPTYDVFDEDRYFEPAQLVVPVNFKNQHLGISICEDIWNDSDFWSRRQYLMDPVESLHRQGMDILINISASPFHVGKPQLRVEMVQAICKKYNVPAVYVNQVGGNDNLLFDGHSFCVNAQGELTWMAPSCQSHFEIVDLEVLKPIKHTWEPDLQMIEDGLVMGVKDYLAKTGFKSVVLGLSGGIDSALTAAIATKALGSENVLGIGMPSQYSSEGSVTDAKALADNLGIQYEEIPIKPMFESFTGALSSLFSEYSEDVTEENLQARIRGDLLMALSNKMGHLLLTTGNKSEMAVGYCTLYGDMCGGLAVISDLPKTWVYELSNFMNRESEIIPQNTITKPPSAELRPDQKDQDTLPDYDVLDAILEAYIEEDLDAKAIIAKGYPKETVEWIIKKINFNEYKRRQAPPGLKVTRKAFGQGRRYPIARGYDT